MKVAVANDHGGLTLKPELLKQLAEENVEVIDFGVNENKSVDYPEYALMVAEAVANKQADMGILICGTGIGISIAANKVKGVRCAHCADSYSAKMTREHNDANIIAFGGRTIGVEIMREIVYNFLHTEFAGGRHEKRVNKITEIENKYFK